MVCTLKKLLKTYRESLNDTTEQIQYLLSTAYKSGYTADEIKEDYVLLVAIKADLEFIVKWLEMGYQHDAHWRGIEKSDAYNLGEFVASVPKIRNIKRPVNPRLIDCYFEDKRAQQFFDNVTNEDTRTIEEKEQDEILDAKEKVIKKGLFIKLEQAQQVLSPDDIYMLLAYQQGVSQEEMAEELKITQQAVSKRIKSIKKKLESIGIERTDL